MTQASITVMMKSLMLEIICHILDYVNMYHSSNVHPWRQATASLSPTLEVEIHLVNSGLGSSCLVKEIYLSFQQSYRSKAQVLKEVTKQYFETPIILG
uniref:Uncharacterized protein n=1 Tax=Nelumbo nucifera TaxID=4432 RepID=A0A822YY50_NELNU|nr:TPA_asm: hypothetical protein HUJ06_004818 [Nelumbo nucifera]